MTSILTIPQDPAVQVTNGATAILFSEGQTLDEGTALWFSTQPGVVYTLAASVQNSSWPPSPTPATLKTPYTGPSSASAIAFLDQYLPPGPIVLGSGPIANGATSMTITLEGAINIGRSENPNFPNVARVWIDSLPGTDFWFPTPLVGNAGQVLTLPFLSWLPLTTPPHAVATPYTGPSASEATVVVMELRRYPDQ